ncbi:MAG: sugar transferase [Chloroflexota bacterium]
MQALLYATNESPCMEPLSQNVPTPLIPVINKPIMAFTIEELSKQGYRDIIITLHELGGRIESYFGTGRRWGVNLRYVLQKDPIGNGGSLAKAASLLDSDHLLFLPGDKLYFTDFDSLRESHVESRTLLTVATATKQPHTHLNGFSGNGHPKPDIEKPTGIFVFNRDLVTEIERAVAQKGTCDILNDVVPGLKQKGISVNYHSVSNFQDPLCDFQIYNDAQNSILSTAFKSGREEKSNLEIDIPGTKYGNGVWVGKNCVIHPSVRITPPVVIGNRCQIGREVELGPNVVIGSHVIIDDEATVRDSTVMDYTYVGHLVNIEKRFIYHNLIVDNQSSEHVTITDPFILGEAAPRVVNRSLRRFYDFAWSALLLLLLSPFLMLIGFLSLLVNRRVFQHRRVFGTTYSQIHSGAQGSPGIFSLINFATSRPDDSDTWFGNWLKSTEIYRLPELLNVLSGKLSLVGVKPIQVRSIEQFNEEWQYQKFNYSCGFTGLWYTEPSTHITAEAAIIFDVYYVAMRDFREDLRIFASTPRAWWLKMTQNS